MSDTIANPIPTQADVLLVTATKTEFLAVQKLFLKESQQPTLPFPHLFIGSKTYYYLGTIANTTVFLVLSEMGGSGLGGAAQTVQKGIDALNPGAVILVGIAFGADETKQKIGDVLVSRQMFLYEHQRLSTRGDELEIRLRGDKATASPRLLDRFHNTELSWSLQNEEKKYPQVHFGVIATGEKLVDNYTSRAQIKDWTPGMVGGEMEGSGLYVAATDSKVDWILVKAICDWGFNKGQDEGGDEEQRQQIAAHNAALFVLDTIKQGGLMHPNPDTGQPGGSGTDGVQIVNHAANQGAQGVFHGPLTIHNDNRKHS